jgi:hypothetical protein
MADARVGHRRVASSQYLTEREVTFVIGHPRLQPSPDPRGLEPGEFFVEVEDLAGDVAPGTRFYLPIGTTGDPEALIASLRARGVRVFEREDFFRSAGP